MRKSDSPSTRRLARLGKEELNDSRQLPDAVRRLWADTSREDHNRSSLFEPSLVPALAGADDEACVLCERRISDKQMPTIINTALFKKYCSSQKQYYYDKDIAILIEGENYPITLQFDEVVIYSESKEYLSRLYRLQEFCRKFSTLWKFHQFARVRPGVFGQSTFRIVSRNHWQKRHLHEKAIRKMLDRLTNSELQQEDIDLEVFMKDSVMFEEDPRKAAESKMIDENEIRPMKMLHGGDLREALKGTIDRHYCDSSGKAKKWNSRQLSYQLLQSCEADLQLLQGGKIDRAKMPSFYDGSGFQRKESQAVDISGFFKKDPSVSGFVRTAEEPFCQYELDPRQLRKKAKHPEIKFKGFDQVHDAREIKDAMARRDIDSLSTLNLTKKGKALASKHQTTNATDEKENQIPNLSAEHEEFCKTTFGNNSSKLPSEHAGATLLGRFKMNTKSTIISCSKQSKQSGLFSTRDDEARPHSKEQKREAPAGESRPKSSNNPSKERDNPAKKAKAVKLKIMVPDNEKLDLNLLRSGQLSIKTGNAELSAAQKKKSLREKPKKKFNACDIDRFIQEQIQTPSEATHHNLLRPTSKEKKLESAHSREDLRKKTAESKRSVGKEGKFGYFVAKNYCAGAAKNAGRSVSGKHSKDKPNPRLIQTSSQIRLAGLATGQDSKLQTMRNLDSLRAVQRNNSKPILSFMSTRRLFEEKVLCLEASRGKSRGVVGNSCQSQTLAEEKLAGKESVRVSKLISPKNQNWMDRFPQSTQRAPSSRGLRIGRQEIFESLRRCKNNSANRSGLGDTTKQSIKIPKPRKKEKTKSAKEKKQHSGIESKTRHEFLKHSIPSISHSREGLLLSAGSSQPRLLALISASVHAQDDRHNAVKKSLSQKRVQAAQPQPKKKSFTQRQG